MSGARATARWAIFNPAGYRWGREDYLSELEAKADLRAFYKGCAGVKLDRFSFEEHAADVVGQITHARVHRKDDTPETIRVAKIALFPQVIA